MRAQPRALRPALLVRPAIFLLALAISIWWVASNEDHGALIRSFLRNLLRHLF